MAVNRAKAAADLVRMIAVIPVIAANAHRWAAWPR
jgi:hypothetical protein